MTSKGYTTNILLASCAFVAITYCINKPFFPIKTATKRSLGYPEDSLLNFTELTAKYGYVSEEHIIETEDGYLLKMFRVVKGKNCKGKVKSPPVILMHGCSQTSNSFLDAGPKAGLGYLLPDACYDLWVGNARGNYYSRNHKTLNPDKDPEFWRFTADEIGYYDNPALIDYVIDFTKSDKVNFIGYSQGSLTFYIMCSERPEFCDKVNLHIGLASASRMTHIKGMIFKFVGVMSDRLRPLLESSGFHEAFAKGGFYQEFMAFLCQCSTISIKFCGILNAMIDSYHPGSITDETTSLLSANFPTGTSLQNMARYGQSFTTPNFEKFDFGKSKNLELYGSEKPPQYNLSAVTVPVVILYGKNDNIVDPEDVRWLVKQLPNVIEAEEVKDPLWNHLDMVYSQYVNNTIFPKINEYLHKYSYGDEDVFVDHSITSNDLNVIT